jgi:hypothetical protein
MTKYTTNTWVLSASETEQLRAAPDAPSNAGVYRKRDLIALVYVDTDTKLWNMLLSVARNARDPALHELLEARLSLLPTIESFQIAPKSAASPTKWLPNVHLFHLTEIDDKPTAQ